MIKKQDYIPDLILERYLLTELDPQTTDYICTRLEKDKALKARLKQLEKSNQEILKHYPPEIMALQIQNKYKKTRPKQATGNQIHRFRAYPLIGLTGIAAAVLLFIFLFPIIYSSTPGRYAIGWGAHMTVADECKRANIKKALITTTGLKGTGAGRYHPSGSVHSVPSGCRDPCTRCMIRCTGW